MAATDLHGPGGGMHLRNSEAIYFEPAGSDTTDSSGNIDVDLTSIFASILHAEIQIRSDTNLNSYTDADIHGLQMLAGGTYGGVADTIIVQPGFCFARDGSRLKLTANQTIEMTTAGDQRGDGAGGAYAASAAGSYLAVYLQLQTDGTVDVVVSNVAAVAEDSVPTANGGTDVTGAYRLIGVIPIGVGPALMDTFTESTSASVRRTSLMDPTGDISAAAGTAQAVLIANTGDNDSELPASNIRRKANFSITFDPAEGGMAVDDAVAIANAGSTQPLAKVVIEVGADQAQEQYASADVITGTNGQEIGVLLVTAAKAHIRINWYDTDCIIAATESAKSAVVTIFDADDDAVAGHLKFKSINVSEGTIVASTALKFFYVVQGVKA